jgi:hypothetical protein
MTSRRGAYIVFFKNHPKNNYRFYHSLSIVLIQGTRSKPNLNEVTCLLPIKPLMPSILIHLGFLNNFDISPHE